MEVIKERRLMLEHDFWGNFRKWIPHQEIREVYDIEKVWSDNEAALSVLLRPEGTGVVGSVLRLVWDSVVSYTVSDESYRPELWESEKTPNQEIWNFYISETSDHLSQFRKENYLVTEKTHHFFICGYNLMVDVLAEAYPTVVF